MSSNAVLLDVLIIGFAPFSVLLRLITTPFFSVLGEVLS